MPGPKPVPTEVLKLRKGKLYDKFAARDEVEPKLVKPLPPRVPSYFDKEHRKVWNRIKNILLNYGILNAASEIDMHILVVSYLKWQDYESKDDVTKSQKYLTAVFKAKQNLGLSNADMAKLGSLMVSAQKKKSEMEALLD